MKQLTEELLREIKDLIDSRKWDDAEKLLRKQAKTGPSTCYYYLGRIYSSWDNPNKNDEEARRYFTAAAECADPVEDAFIRLATIERNKTHSIRILRKGLKTFAKSEAMYYRLLTYTESSKKEDVYKEILEKGCESERIRIDMIQHYFDLKDYEKVLSLISNLHVTEDWDRNVLALIKAFSLYEIGLPDKAGEIFQVLIEEDINHQLNHIPHFGLILVLLHQDNLSKAEQFADEISLDKAIDDGPTLDPGPWGKTYLDAKDYCLATIALMENKSKKKKIVGIMRGFRGLMLYGDAFESEPAEKKLQPLVKKDLEFAAKQFPQDKQIAYYLFRIFKESNPPKAWEYLLKYIESGGDDSYEHEIAKFIQRNNPEALQGFVNDVQERSKDYFLSQKIAKSLLRPIIDSLARAKMYQDIIATAGKFSESALVECDALFHLAYSSYEVKDLPSSKRYYELYIEKQGEDNPAVNNLGLVYEKMGNLTEARRFYQRAVELDNADQTSARNLKRIEDELKKKNRFEAEMQAVLERFRDESPYVWKKVLDFNSHKNEDGLIICSYRNAPQFLNMSGVRATDFLNDLLQKRFFVKVTDHKYNTQSNVYRLNPCLESNVAEIEGALKDEDELIAMGESLNINALNEIGYNDDLLKNIAKISSNDLKRMLERDLKENAFAVLLKQLKSALVLSGSIIEAVLTDRITAQGTVKYKVGSDTRPVLNMDLHELLGVAEKEKIIDPTMAHLAHAVRGYRNLIHPGVEQRKKTLQVDDSNVKLAWSIVKKLLNDIV